MKLASMTFVAALAASLLAPAALAPLAQAQAARAPANLDDEGARRLQERLRTLALEATPKTVCVYGMIGLGTGAIVDAKGTVVTNAHVAAGARWAVVMTSSGERKLYKRRGIDYEKDLAVLVPEEPFRQSPPFFTLKTTRPETGDDLVALGYPGGPRGADPRPTFTFGRAVEGTGNLSVMGILDYQDAIRTDVPTFSGNSGGPLVDMEGRLCGLNGAVDLSHQGNGLAVPAALVAERLRTLQGGMIRLPGGRSLDPRTNPLVRRLEEALDPIVKRMADANLKTPVDPPAGAAGALGSIMGSKGDPEAAAAFLESAARTGRNRDLSALMSEPPGVRGTLWLSGRSGAKVPATPLSVSFAVACAVLVPVGTEALTDDRGVRHEVVARSEENGLVLLRSEARPSFLRPEHRDVVEVGTLVGVVDAQGRATAGVISAPARRISEWNARALAASSEGNPVVVKILEGVKSLARLLGSKEVEDLVTQIEAAQKMKRGFAAASTGRGFELVLSHDAPVAPSLAGSALLDLQGRIVGIHVANAHFGTSYAVPITAVRAAFQSHLGEAGRARTGPREDGARPAPRQEGARPGTDARRRPDEPRRAPAPERSERRGERREF